MGERGRGRPTGHARRTSAGHSLPLDIRRLQRCGAITPGCSCSWQWTMNGNVYASIQIRAEARQVELIYNYTPPGRPVEVVRQAVMLNTTPCTLGGQRLWFSCPTCPRRVAVIYGSGRHFGCRICKSLPYASQRESADDRAVRRAERIRKQLGWIPGIVNEPGLKPMGMHWRTFRSLVSEHDKWAAAALAGMGRRLALIDGMLADIRDRIQLL